jgi:hypothetical protein
MRRWVLIVLWLVVPLTVAAQELDVPVTLMETAGVAREAEPVSVGVPMPRNLLADTRGLCVVDPQGKKVPAQFEVLMQWFPTPKYPKASGIRWVLVDFQADVPAKGKTTYRLRNTGPGPLPKAPVKVDASGGALKMETGPIEFKIDRKKFRLFDWVKLDGKKVVDRDGKDGLCIEGMDGKRYHAHQDLREPPTLTDADYRGNYDGWLRHTQHNPPRSSASPSRRQAPSGRSS